jgi:hypothetical protein
VISLGAAGRPPEPGGDRDPTTAAPNDQRDRTTNATERPNATEMTTVTESL